MPDCCLASLAKVRETLKLKDLVEFFEPWHAVDKHANDIFQCLEINRPPLDTDIEPLFQLPSLAERKNALQTIQTSKKLKDMDDLVIAKDIQITDLRDQWLVTREKTPSEIKI